MPFKNRYAQKGSVNYIFLYLRWLLAIQRYIEIYANLKKSEILEEIQDLNEPLGIIKVEVKKIFWEEKDSKNQGTKKANLFVLTKLKFFDCPRNELSNGIEFFKPFAS